LLLPCFAGLAMLLAAESAHSLPASAYRVDLISEPGKTWTSIRGVDQAGRALGYWSFFSQPPPRPVFAEPDDEGYFLWENGTHTPFAIPGLTSVNIHQMNVAGAMWGSSDQGSFVYSNGHLDIVQSPDVDVTLVQGVDAVGRVYGLLGNLPEGVDPDGALIPIDLVSSFVWQSGTFSELNLLLADSMLQGVRQDGVLWGSNPNSSFIQDGLSLTVLDHPGFDFTGLRMLTARDEAYGFGFTATDEAFESGDFFWDPIGGFQTWPDDAKLPGTSVRPNSLNEAGVFWGWAGANTAFVATPIPEPSTALLLGLGIGLAVLRRASSD
jgi:hypothetical protein